MIYCRGRLLLSEAVRQAVEGDPAGGRALRRGRGPAACRWLYIVFVWAKASLNLFDAGVLILIYVAYLLVLGKMPPQEAEGIEDLELIPRTHREVPADACGIC